jgi:serine/threonine protein kinase
MERRDLYDFLEVSLGKISEADAHEIMIGITLVVDYLPSNCIAHRDPKPGNILLRQELDNSRVLDHKNIRICDFGSCADSIIPGFATWSDLRGSPGFLAPEIIQKSSNYDGAAADVWSLGCIMLKLLCGHKSSSQFGYPRMSEICFKMRYYLKSLLQAHCTL